MMIRPVCAITMATFFLVAAAAPPEARAAAPDALFKDKKCVQCHSIANLKIEKQVSKKTGKPKKGPDLSGVGLDRDADFIAKFANKEIESPSIYNKDKKVKHKKKFKGTPEELKALAGWLAQQKTKVEVKEAAAEEEEEEEKDED
ncbi:MAG: c-type cytochrome [Nitrospirae bacterium]|nr:c-type cytochrome [Nitrospirota bacterium]